MVLILSIVLGLVIGLLAGGRLERLGQVRITWAPLAITGLAIQLVLFSPPVVAWIGDLGAAGPVVYVGSTALVLAALLRNLRQPGLALIALGAALNAVVILANGGYMPVSPDALAAIGRLEPSGTYANTVLATSGTLLPWFGDIIPLPLPVPLRTVVSLGDLLIGAGATVFLVRVMTRGEGSNAA